MNGTTTLILAAMTGLAAVTGTLTAGTPNEVPYLQYGALGLCALMVVAFLKVCVRMIKHLETKDRQMQDMIEKDRAERERKGD